MFFSEYRAFKLRYAYKISRKASSVYCAVRNYAALAFRLSGESVLSSEGKMHHADEGSLLYIPAGVAYARESMDEEILIVHLYCDCAAGDSIEVIYPQERSYVAEQMQHICNEWQEKQPGYQHRCTAMLYMLLSKLQTEHGNFAPYKYALIQPGVDYINSNFDAPQITVGMLAELCHISPEYFRRLYKEKHGISPQAVIIERRMEKACRLLQSGDFSVSAVAEQCGFRDVKHFSTLFKKKMNVSPKSYGK